MVRCKLLRWLLLILMTLTGAVHAEQESVRPGINRHYEHPDFQRWVNTFERPGREVFDRRNEIVAATGVSAGMDVADVGAGTGLFTLLFARQVEPDGTVYAVDISSDFVRNIVSRARAAGFDNVQGVINHPHGAALPQASVDLVFLSDTYHHFEYPRDMLASLHSALRPDGTMVVVDFERIPGRSSDWVLEHVRADRRTVIKEIEAAGFRLIEDSSLLKTNYLLRFEPVPTAAD